MAPSLSSVERSNPPPRRKSCMSCIKAKRRCDLGSPACLRCRQRKLECTYSSGTTPRRTRPVSPVASPSYPTPAFDFSLDLPHSPPASSKDGPTPLDSSSSMLDPSLSMPLSMFDDELGISDVNITETLFNEFLPSTLDFSTPLEISPPMKTSLNIFPPPVQGSQDTRTLFNWAIQTRLQYTVDKLAGAPRQMVEQNQMPWCHRHLYSDDMPRCIQDAVSSAALYMAKNEVNSGVIRNCIESRVQDLLSSPIPTAPKDLLARTHALLIYQLLRLFDPDIRAQAAAEAVSPHLESIAFALISHIVFDEPGPSDVQRGNDVLPLYPLAATREFWKNWIFQESARRTFLMTFFCLQTYRTLKGVGPMCCDGKLFLCHSWTLSAHLWHANDPVDFAIAWREKNHFVISDNQIKEAMKDAKGDDIDIFGKMLITAMMGIEEAKGWLAVRGGTL